MPHMMSFISSGLKYGNKEKTVMNITLQSARLTVQVVAFTNHKNFQ